MRANRTLTGFYLLQTMQAFGVIDRLVYGEWFDKQGDKITQSLNILLITTSLLLFLQGYRRSRRLGTGAILVLVLTGFMFLSALWSIDPETTVRRAFLYAWVVLGAIGIANILTGDEFMKLLRLTCFGAAIASIALVVFSPSAAFDLDSDALRGVFANKEVLGGVMVVAVLAALHGLHLGRRRLLNVLMLAVFMALAFASHASTRMLTIVALCAIDGIASLLRKGAIARFVAGSLAIFLLLPVAAFAVSNMDAILEALGKDPTLTGRTDLWPYVVARINESPLLGWGFSAFWTAPNGPADLISIISGWHVANAHNTLLEILLEMGFVGAALFICIFLGNIMLSIRCIRTQEKELAISSLLNCIGICLVGIAEVTLTEPFALQTGMFFISGLICERAVRDARQRRAHPPQVAPTLLGLKSGSGRRSRGPSIYGQIVRRLEHAPASIDEAGR